MYHSWSFYIHTETHADTRKTTCSFKIYVWTLKVVNFIFGNKPWMKILKTRLINIKQDHFQSMRETFNSMNNENNITIVFRWSLFYSKMEVSHQIFLIWKVSKENEQFFVIDLNTFERVYLNKLLWNCFHAISITLQSEKWTQTMPIRLIELDIYNECLLRLTKKNERGTLKLTERQCEKMNAF